MSITKINALLGSILVLSTIGAIVLVNIPYIFTMVNLLFLSLVTFLNFYFFKNINNKNTLFFSILCMLSLILGWVTKSFYLFTLGQLLSFLLGLLFVTTFLVKCQLIRPVKYFLVSVTVFFIGLFTILFSFQISSKPYSLIVQKATGITNSYDPIGKKEEHVKLLDTFNAIKNIEYSTQFPNSFLDIYFTNINTSKPTYIYLHGGGFVTGDKETFDPFAPEKDNIYFSSLLSKGYNIVSINYGLAPDQKFPNQIFQLSQAIEYLKTKNYGLGINTSSFILSGGSAGGLIIGQFTLAQINSDYAEKIDISPVLKNSEITAVVFDSALLDISRISEIQSPNLMTEYIFKLTGRAYINPGGFPDNYDEILRAGDIIDNVTSDFPPTFIADGNVSTFPNQATDLANKLTKLGVKNNLYLANKGKVVHGFMAFTSKETKIYNQRKLDFLELIENKNR